MEALFFEMMMVERGASANTLTAYARDLTAVRDFLGRPLETASRSDLQAYFQGPGRQLAARSAARRLSALKQFYDAFAAEPRVQAIAIQTVFEGFFTNTKAKVRDQQVRYDLPIVMGHDAGDPNGDHLPKTMRQYRTGGTPWIVVIDPRGIVVFNDFHINVGGAIEHIRSKLA